MTGARGRVMATRTATKPSADLAFLCRALKAPSLAASIDRLATRARDESWTHEEFLAACLEREVVARQDHGGEGRIRAARFPARKTLEDFDYDHQRSLKRDTVLHLGTLDFVAERANVVFLGPPGTGKTHLAIGLSIRACQAGHRVAFATAAEWVARLADAHTQGRLQAELTRLGRIPSSSSTRSATSPSTPMRQHVGSTTSSDRSQCQPGVPVDRVRRITRPICGRMRSAHRCWPIQSPIGSSICWPGKTSRHLSACLLPTNNR
jgi:IstB-like ATP binding protein